ncbi:universal stress protein [Fundidesulfovibrio butyratiphilus]
MIRTILAAVDCSQQQRTVLEHTAWLAIQLDARVHVVSVARPDSGWTAALSGQFGAVSQVVEIEVRSALDQACSTLSEKGIPCSTHSAVGSVAQEIARLAEELQVDLVVIGHRELSWLDKLVDSSVGQDLIACAPCNVLVVRD